MNLDYYQYIATTAECGSISKAAEKLHLRQQNLSGTIRKVEQYYGITIFTRDVKGITLTKDGECFLEKIRQILAIADELEQTHLYPSKRIMPMWSITSRCICRTCSVPVSGYRKSKTSITFSLMWN